MLWILLIYQVLSFLASLFLLIHSKNDFWRIMNAVWAALSEVGMIYVALQLIDSYGGLYGIFHL